MMKRLFFILLFVPALGFAQSLESIDVFLKTIPEKKGRSVSLPPSSNYDIAGMKDSKGRYKRNFIVVVTSDSLYHKIFGQYIYTKESLKNWVPTADSFYYKLMCEYSIDSLPVFDFSKQELVLYSACGQCLAFCNHHGEEGESCHRNACYLQEAWCVREKNSWIVKKSGMGY